MPAASQPRRGGVPVKGRIRTGMGKISSGAKRDLERVAGSAAAEVGEMIADARHPRRALRCRQVLDRAARILAAEGRTGAVPAGVLFPVLDCAAGEVDERLLGMWAALLARAASPDAVPPAFVEILRQLNATEAAFLLGLPDCEAPGRDADCGCPEPAASPGAVLGTDVDLLMRYLKLGLGRPTETREQALKNIPGDIRDFMALLDRLEGLQLLRHRIEAEAPGWEASSGVSGLDPVRVYYLTELGFRFIRACRPPSGLQSVLQ